MDTSGSTASVALFEEIMEEGKREILIISESFVVLKNIKKSATIGKATSQTLMPMIEHILSNANLPLESVDSLACTSGPGSFTGLRIGAATAKGLAFALGKPLIPIPTLDVLAYNALTADIGTIIVPLLDARRGQVYGAVYRLTSTFTIERLTDYFAEDIVDLAKKAERVRDESNFSDGGIIFLGSGAENYRDSISSIKGACFLPKHYNVPHAACMGYLIPDRMERDFDESNFSLTYLRKSQAEREKTK